MHHRRERERRGPSVDDVPARVIRFTDNGAPLASVYSSASPDTLAKLIRGNGQARRDVVIGVTLSLDVTSSLRVEQAERLYVTGIAPSKKHLACKETSSSFISFPSFIIKVDRELYFVSLEESPIITPTLPVTLHFTNARPPNSLCHHSNVDDLFSITHFSSSFFFII